MSKDNPVIANPEKLAMQPLLPDTQGLTFSDLPKNLEEKFLATPAEAYTVLCNLASLAVNSRPTLMDGGIKKVKTLRNIPTRTYTDPRPGEVPSPDYSEALTPLRTYEGQLEDASQWFLEIEAPGKLIRRLDVTQDIYEDRGGLFYDGPEYDVVTVSSEQGKDIVGPGFILSVARTWFSPEENPNDKVDAKVKISAESILDLKSRVLKEGNLTLEVEAEDRKERSGYRTQPGDPYYVHDSYHRTVKRYESLNDLLSQKKLSKVDQLILLSVAQTIVAVVGADKKNLSAKLPKIVDIKPPTIAT